MDLILIDFELYSQISVVITIGEEKKFFNLMKNSWAHYSSWWTNIHLYFYFLFSSPTPLEFPSFPHGHSKFLWNIHLNMNEENAMARAEIKISLFTALEFGNAISICTVWPRDIYCFGLSSLYCGVSFIPSSSLWCYHLLITSSSLRLSLQLLHSSEFNMWAMRMDTEMIHHAMIAVACGV